MKMNNKLATAAAKSIS